MTLRCRDSRERVVEVCRRLAGSKLGVGMAGNVSCRDAETGYIAMSPSAMDYMAMTAADVVLLDAKGERVEGERRPSSEWPMHLGCYQRRATIGAIVHTHSPAATTMAVLGQELPAVHYMIALNDTDRIPLAPYHRFGSTELAAAAVEAMGEGWACLLENHGVLAAGADLDSAWDLAENIEFCAELYLRASAVGQPQILSAEQVAAVVAQFGSYQKQR